MKMKMLAVVVLPVALAACSSLQPSADELRRLPIVEFGQPVPVGTDYILHFPADKPIPTEVSIKGSIFAREAEQRVDVALRRGIYAYKELVSYDLVTWRPGREAIKSDFQIRLPSYKHPEPGLIKIQMDAQN
jgi:hypothetical protein